MTKEILSQAQKAYDSGDHTLARDLVRPLADAGDREAQVLLRTWCMCEASQVQEAERWLLGAADAGHGQAAHNLAVLYQLGWPGRPPDTNRAAHYFQVAVDSGFEANVAGDPRWWTRG